MMWVAEESGRANLDVLLAAGGLEELAVAEALAQCPALDPAWLAAAAIDIEGYDINVAALHAAFVRTIYEHAGSILTNEPVTAVVRANPHWMVQTPVSTFETPLVVNAAGAWADVVAKMAGVPKIGLRPLRRTLCQSPVHWPCQIISWPTVVDVGDAVQGARFYFKPEQGGQLLLSPCDETLVEPDDVRPDVDDVDHALQMVNRATRLGLKSVTSAWAGLRSFVTDRHPVVGERVDEPGFFWFAAIGIGIQMAPALARTGAAIARGEPLPEDVRRLGVQPEQIAPNRLDAGSE
jgi:D-arginine dehydrogenase